MSIDFKALLKTVISDIELAPEEIAKVEAKIQSIAPTLEKAWADVEAIVADVAAIRSLIP